MLNKTINASKEAQLWRQRALIPNDALCFNNNDYLNHAAHPELKEKTIAAIEAHGVGARASQLVAGYHPLQKKFEQRFAEYCGYDNALLFGSGYLANLGVISALADHHSQIILDRQNHASHYDGVRLSGAPFKRYPHLNYDKLQSELAKTEHALMIAERVFSCTGVQADIQRLMQLSQQHNSTLIVDDAHGFGILNPITPPVLIVPLGKAFGVYGAMVCGSHTMIDYLVQFARSAMYSTALPPALSAAGLASLECLAQEPWRLEKLRDNIRYFKACCQREGINTIPSDTAIHAIEVSDNQKALNIVDQLKKQGIFITLLRSPSTPSNKPLLRISLCTNHQHRDIDRLITALKKALASC